jgi:hypothetical protein
LKKNAELFLVSRRVVTVTTCREAEVACKQAGSRIHWRPDGAVNWMLPELDAAQVLEG